MRIDEALEIALAEPGPLISGAPTEGRLNEILEAARLAPSAYNMQPWHFQVLVSLHHRKEVAEAFSLPFALAAPPAWILCLMDRDRMLPVADPLGTETYIALGMACLNIQVVSAAQGLACRVVGPFASANPSWRPRTFSFPSSLEPYFLFLIGEGGRSVSSLGPVPAVFRMDSFRSEPRRVYPPPKAGPGMDTLRCVRLRRIDREALQRGGPWAEDCLRILSAGCRALEAHKAEGVELLLVEDDEKTMGLSRLQEKAWRTAMANRGRFTEVCQWLRFTKEEWQRRGDGELVHHVGLGPLKRAVVRLGLRTGLAPLAITLGAGHLFLRRAQPSAAGTGAFLTTVLEDPEGRFPSDDLYRRRVLTGVGGSLQAIWLTATALGASLQFQTSSIVVEEVRAEVRRALGVPETHDLLSLIRMGYPVREMDYTSLRRDRREILSRTA